MSRSTRAVQYARGGYVAPPVGRKGRVCQVCEAPVGHACVRWREEDGLRWKITLRHLHKER